jgi:hypothetical protein
MSIGTILLIVCGIWFVLYALDCQKRDDAIANRYAGLFGEDPRNAKEPADHFGRWFWGGIVAIYLVALIWERLQ